MEKEIAINILQDIENSLMQKNWKEKSLKTIALYRKGLEVATSTKIRKLIEKQKEYLEKYGESGKKTLQINKKIDDEIRRIYNN